MKNLWKFYFNCLAAILPKRKSVKNVCLLPVQKVRVPICSQSNSKVGVFHLPKIYSENSLYNICENSTVGVVSTKILEKSQHLELITSSPDVRKNSHGQILSRFIGGRIQKSTPNLENRIFATRCQIAQVYHQVALIFKILQFSCKSADSSRNQNKNKNTASFPHHRGRPRAYELLVWPRNSNLKPKQTFVSENIKTEETF